MRRFLLSLTLLASVAFAAPAQPSAAAKAAFDRGEKAFADGRYDEALAAYQEAVKATPGYAAALTGVGSVQFKQDKKADAIANFRAASEADPGFKLAWFNLGYAARKTSDFATAATAYEKYTALDPNDPDGFYGLGESHKALGNTDQAIAAYEQFLKKETRASEQKWIDKAKDAVAVLKATPPKPVVTAAASAPAPAPSPSAEALPALSARKVAEGDKLLSEKKYREASFAYQDAVNADPKDAGALIKLGNTYAMLGYYAQAIDQWTKAGQLSTDPQVQKVSQDNIAKAQKKMSLSGGGSPPEQNKPPGSGPVADSTRSVARQYYEQAVKLIGERRYGEALGALNECVKLEPTLAVGYVARGSTLVGLRRYAEAAVDYQYALRLDPSMASPLYGLAQAYNGMSRVDDARTYFQKYVASSAPDVRPELQTEARQAIDRLR
ncbi:MAG: tetratricopeptide repeat protein [Archangium sp.]|nr:tetratricopeptide repeat protein [Archangium sp.]